MRSASRPQCRRRRRNSSSSPVGRLRPIAESLEARALLTMGPLVRPPFVSGVVAGQAQTIVVASFTDTDPSLTPAGFAASIHWGDGTSGAGSITEDAQGTFTVSGVKTYADQGSYPLAVSVRTTSGTEVRYLGSPTTFVLDGPDPAFDGTRGVYDGPAFAYVANHGSALLANGAGSVGVLGVEDGLATAPAWTIPLIAPASGVADPTGIAPAANPDGSFGGLLIATTSGAIEYLPESGGALDAYQNVTATSASIVLDHSASGADYEGITTGYANIANPAAPGTPAPVAYVANFGSGKVEVYGLWGLSSATPALAPVDLGAGAFVDPNLPAGYAPFNVQAIDGVLYVAYAKTSGTPGQAVDGAGDGYLAAFDSQGKFLTQYDAGGTLDAPWGIALAGPSYGAYAGDLLVANTADGTIQAFTTDNLPLSLLLPIGPQGTHVGPVTVLDGNYQGPAAPTYAPTTIPGLWGLASPYVGVLAVAGADPTLYYTVNSEASGQLGTLPVGGYAIDVSAPMPPSTTQLQAFSIYAFAGDPAVDFTVGQFFDADGTHDGRDLSKLSGTIDWGDGSAPSPVNITFTPGGLPDESVFYIDATHHYDTPGDYTAELTLTMDGGSTYQVPVAATVVDGTRPDPIVDPVPILMAGGPPVTGISAPPTVSATATAPVTAALGRFDGPPGAYRVAIDWGDGSTATFGEVKPVITLIHGGFSLNADAHDLAGSHTYSRPGTYTVLINVTGPGGLSEWSATTADVAPAFLALRGGDRTLQATQGQPLAGGPLATFTYNDPHAYHAPSTFVAAVDWRDGSAPTFATVSLVVTLGSGQTPYYAVNASHVYRTPGAYTPYINVIAPDGESQWALGRVAAAPDPSGPSNIAADGPLAATKGFPGLSNALATFDAPAGAYRAAVDWGDGSDTFAQVKSLGSDNGLGVYGVYGSHTYTATGTFPVLVNILAPNGDSDWALQHIVVGPLPGAPTHVTPGPVSGPAGVALTVFPVTFDGLYSQQAPYKAAIDWGDGVSTFATVTTDLGDHFLPVGLPGLAVEGAHTYGASGKYTLKIAIVAPDGSTTWTSTTATIAPGNLTLQGNGGAPIPAQQGTPLTDARLAEFHYLSGATNPSATDFRAAVDWGDGTSTFATVQLLHLNDPLPGQSAPPAGTFGIVVGSHTYLTPGRYTTLIHVSAPDGEGLWASSKITVVPDPTGPADLTPVAVRGTQDVPLPGDLLAEFRLPTGDTHSYVAAVDWGDGSTPSFGQVIPIPVPQIVSIPPLPPPPNMGIAGSHTYLNPGTYNIKVNMIRSDGESGWIGTTATIAGSADPVLDLSGVPVSGTQGVPLADARLAQFQTPGPSGYRVAIDWGDGSASHGRAAGTTKMVVLGGVDAYEPTDAAFGSHTYALPGTYAIKVNLLGPDGESLWVGTSATIAPAPVPPPPPIIDVFLPPPTRTVAWSAALAWARQVADRSRLS